MVPPHLVRIPTCDVMSRPIIPLPVFCWSLLGSEAAQTRGQEGKKQLFLGQKLLCTNFHPSGQKEATEARRDQTRHPRPSHPPLTWPLTPQEEAGLIPPCLSVLMPSDSQLQARTRLQATRSSHSLHSAGGPSTDNVDIGASPRPIESDLLAPLVLFLFLKIPHNFPVQPG